MDSDPLDRRGIVLNTVNRVGDALSIVIRKRQALRVIEKLGSEGQYQPFTSIGFQHGAEKASQIEEEGQQDDKPDGKDEDPLAGLRKTRTYPLQKWRHGLRADDAVNHYLERERSKKEERDGEQMEHQHANQVRPVWC